MQERGPGAADLTLTDLQHSGSAFPATLQQAASYRFCRVPASAHSQQQQRSAPPDTVTAGQSRLFSLEACRNTVSASSRKLNHNPSRGQRFLKMQISRRPAQEAGCCRQGSPTAKHLHQQPHHRLSLPPQPEHSSRVPHLTVDTNHQTETKRFASEMQNVSRAVSSANIATFTLQSDSGSRLPPPCLRGRFCVSEVPYF